jgi:rsbT co-antagonist protein RsbR
MIAKLRRWLDNIPLTDPVERQQASVFQWVLISWLILAVANQVRRYTFSGQTSAQILQSMPPLFTLLFALVTFAQVILWICPAAALLALRRGRFKLSVTIATLGLVLGHALATYALGVTIPTLYVVSQIPIALAGLLAGRRLLLTVSGLSIAVMVGVAVLQSLLPPLAGFLSPLAGRPVWVDVGFFVGVTLLLTLLLDRFGSALRDALANSVEREGQLNSIRASLEQMVAERTSALQTALNEVQVQAEEQARLLEEIENQRATIKELSVPVIPISTTTLVMPLVGALDSTRLQQLQEQSLQALERTSARTLVFDITGVPIVDTQVAQGLLMTVRAARLLGAEVALVGIRPEVAQSIVGLGLELRNVSTFSDLQSALEQMTTNTSLRQVRQRPPSRST